MNQWNEARSNGKDVFPGSSKKTGAKSKLNDEHTVFIFEKIHEQPTISCNDVTDLLCQHSKGLNITSRAVNNHIHKKCHLTYKRAVHQLVACDDDTTIYNGTKLYRPGWQLGSISFSSVFLLMRQIQQNMHRFHGWSESENCAKSL